MTQFSIIINTYNRKHMLFDLISSMRKCDLYENAEVIIVDDFSSENYESELLSKFPEVRFVRNTQHEFLIKSRNKGWKLASNEIVLFIDDDNEIKDKEFFTVALELLSKNPTFGVMGCRTYYYDSPDIVLIGPNFFNMFTGKTTFKNLNSKDLSEFEGITATHDSPNAFWTTKNILSSVSGFTEEIIQTFSEADFAQKVKKLGMNVVHVSYLRVYHKSPLTNVKSISVRQMGGSPKRLYYLIRNKFYFIKKWGSFRNRLVFFILFANIYTMFYLYILLKGSNTGSVSEKKSMIRSCLQGTLDGYIYAFTGNLRNYFGI